MATKIKIKNIMERKKTRKQQTKEKKSIYDAEYQVQKSLLPKVFVTLKLMFYFQMPLSAFP